MAKRIINRPKDLEIEEDFFKTNNNISLDKRALNNPEDILLYAQNKNFMKNDNNCLDIENLIKDNEELELKFEDIEQDGCIYKEKNKYIIVINKNHPKTRQRFTMAHEYIHYHMNKDIIEKNIHKDIILYRDETTKLDIDIQANNYAAEILMPATKFRSIVEKHQKNLIEIAKKFQVSTLAVRYRARNLNIEI